MSFLKDLKEDIGSAVDELAADATGEEANSEESTEEVPAGADELEGFDLADDSAVDTDMVNKIMEDEAEEKKSSEKPEKEEKAEMAAEAGELPKGATAPIINLPITVSRITHLSIQQVCFPWQGLWTLIQPAASSSSCIRMLLTLTASTPHSARSQRAWTL